MTQGLATVTLELEPRHLFVSKADFAGGHVCLELIRRLASNQGEDVEWVAHHVGGGNLCDRGV
jgi:hypothetical protein